MVYYLPFVYPPSDDKTLCVAPADPAPPLTTRDILSHTVILYYRLSLAPRNLPESVGAHIPGSERPHRNCLRCDHHLHGDLQREDIRPPRRSRRRVYQGNRISSES